MAFEDQEGRRFKRFIAEFKAQYFTEARPGNWQPCSIMDVSKRGMRVLFHENIAADTMIFMEIFVPDEQVPVSVKGKVKWVAEEGSAFMCGLELADTLDDAKWSKLS